MLDQIGSRRGRRAYVAAENLGEPFTVRTIRGQREQQPGAEWRCGVMDGADLGMQEARVPGNTASCDSGARRHQSADDAEPAGAGRPGTDSSCRGLPSRTKLNTPAARTRIAARNNAACSPDWNAL